MTNASRNAQEVMTMLDAHRLVTKESGTAARFPNTVHASREKVQSLLVMYAGIRVARKKTIKGPELSADVLFQYKRLVRLFNSGYG